LCKAEIVPTNECILKVKNICHLTDDLNCPGVSPTTTIYNDNSAWIAWSLSLTTKGIKYLNLCKTKVWELYALGSMSVLHITG
jgi:hypothetical protein